MKKKTFGLIIGIIAFIALIVGATFAYWSWTSDNSNKTNITFTIGADFSCGASGDGNIASANIAPASCTNSTYAIQRTIITTITNSGSVPVSLDLWLKINSISSSLSNSANFKWALTTNSTTCSSNIVNQGSFQGKSANSTVTILSGDTSTTSTYYLYIWLDNVETNTATMNQSFSMSLGGACTNEQSNYVYTANERNANLPSWGEIDIGFPIANDIDTFNSPQDAIDELNEIIDAYELRNGLDDLYYPFFLRHNVANGSLWCEGDGITEKTQMSDWYFCLYDSQSECLANDDDWLTCSEHTVTDGVLESYVGFVIDSTMVTSASSTYMTNCSDSEFYTNRGFNSTSECTASYSGATAGTYYIKGGDNGKAYNANMATMLRAFGSSNCDDYGYCSIPELEVGSTQDGQVWATQGEWYCRVHFQGHVYCDAWD